MDNSRIMEVSSPSLAVLSIGGSRLYKRGSGWRDDGHSCYPGLDRRMLPQVRTLHIGDQLIPVRLLDSPPGSLAVAMDRVSSHITAKITCKGVRPPRLQGKKPYQVRWRWGESSLVQTSLIGYMKFLTRAHSSHWKWPEQRSGFLHDPVHPRPGGCSQYRRTAWLYRKHSLECDCGFPSGLEPGRILAWICV